MQILTWPKIWNKWHVGLGEFGNNFHMIIDPRFP